MRSLATFAGAIASVGSLLAAGVAEGAAQPPADCALAGTRVRVVAQSAGGARQTVTYVIANHGREPIRWLQLGAGSPWPTIAVDRQRPTIVTTPAGWRSAVVYPPGTQLMHLSWEVTHDDFALRPNAHMTVAIEAPAPRSPSTSGVGAGGTPARPILYTSMPFMVGDASGACWRGWTTTSGAGTPVGGYLGGVTAGSIRAFAAAGRDIAMIEMPRLEWMVRISRAPVYLTVPVALSWGIRGGFSHDAAIGIGLSWLPIEPVSVRAQSQVGTFLFTNRTHLRHVGIDVNWPWLTVNRQSGAVARDRYVVVGIEYFWRSAVRWAGYMDGQQWYASGRGLAVRIGIRRAAWSP